MEHRGIGIRFTWGAKYDSLPHRMLGVWEPLSSAVKWQSVKLATHIHLSSQDENSWSLTFDPLVYMSCCLIRLWTNLSSVTLSRITAGNRRLFYIKFRVCKSVHHHTFKWINQADAPISQVYCLSFRYSSTCFGHPHAHHQELKNCSSSLMVYRWNVVVAVLLVVVGPTALLPPRSNGKPEAATAVFELLMMGMRVLETCWAVSIRQAINLRNCWICLVDPFGCFTLMYSLFTTAVTITGMPRERAEWGASNAHVNWTVTEN